MADMDKVFDAKAIRDTNTHNSSESPTAEFNAQTMFIENGLDDVVTLQLQGAIDTTWVDVGASFDIAASTDDYKTVTDYFPKFRVTATCATAPTSGSLDVHILKTR